MCACGRLCISLALLLLLLPLVYVSTYYLPLNMSPSGAPTPRPCIPYASSLTTVIVPQDNRDYRMGDLPNIALRGPLRKRDPMVGTRSTYDLGPSTTHLPSEISFELTIFLTHSPTEDADDSLPQDFTPHIPNEVASSTRYSSAFTAPTKEFDARTIRLFYESP